MSRPLSFIPGPSKICPEVYQDIDTAMDTGILEYAHRSEDFIQIAETSIQNLRRYLHIPDEYHVVFTDSASSSWHSMIANTVTSKSAHIVTGSFSKKAHAAAEALYKQAHSHTVDILDPAASVPTEIHPATELITICYSESSNGSAWSESELATIRTMAPQALLGVDGTSCIGAIMLDLRLADIWYFSVQKALGLPAGLGVLVLSSEAVARARSLQEQGQNLAGTWSWHELVQHQQKGCGPTAHTPNMLGIYLLAQQTARFNEGGGLSTISRSTYEKAERIYAHLEQHSTLAPYIPSPAHRSPTVITTTSDPTTISTLHEEACRRHMRLGAGYDTLKSTTLRIANFPSLTTSDVDRLLSWL